MKVEVKLFASLRRFQSPEGQGGKIQVRLAEGATAQDILNHLGISGQEAEIILLNGLRAELNVPLKEGDQISLFPMLGGG